MTAKIVVRDVESLAPVSRPEGDLGPLPEELTIPLAPREHRWVRLFVVAMVVAAGVAAVSWVLSAIGH